MLCELFFFFVGRVELGFTCIKSKKYCRVYHSRSRAIFARLSRKYQLTVKDSRDIDVNLGFLRPHLCALALSTV